jgi:copper chaperone CopZ
METLSLRVEGMSCPHCEMAIQDAVRKLNGIKKTKANRRKKVVITLFDPSLVSSTEIRSIIAQTGYSVID